jgi:hypothetical protein
MIQSDKAQAAADQQQQGAERAAQFNTSLQAPWREAGTKALDRLSLGSQSGGEFNKPFTMADATNSPAMQEAQRAGTEVIQNSAAMKGGLIGSNVMQDLTKFGQANAAQFENQAFNQHMAEQGQQIGVQQSLAGIGQTATNSVADTGANAILAGAGAQAGATAQQGNIMGNTLGQIGNILGQSGIFNPKANPVGSVYTTPNLNGTYNNPTTGSDGMGINAPSTGGDYSDERLKTDVKRVGVSDAGLPIYTYRMRGGGPRKMGVMAQDVEDVIPRAVTKDRAGFRMVDYGMVK